MDLKSKTLQGLGWQIVSVGAISFIQLIVLMVLGRYLKPAEFGIVAFCNIFIGFAQLFSNMGVGPAIIQRQNLTSSQIQGSFYFSLILGLIFTAITYLSVQMVEVFFNTPGVENVMIWLSISFTFIGVGVVAESLLQREMKFKELTVIEVMRYLILALIAIPMAIFGFGVWSLVVSSLVSTFCRNIFMIIYVRHPMRPTFRFREMLGLLNYGGGLTLSRIFNYIASQGDKFVAGKLLGPAMLGYYERAFRIMEVPLSMMGGALDKVLFPAMASIQKETLRLKNNFLKAVTIGYFIQVPVCILMIVLAPELIIFTLGKGWEEAVLPFQILLSTIPIRIMVQMTDSLVRAKGAVYNSAARKALYALMVVFGSWIGHFWGLPGVAIGVAISTWLNYILMTSLAHYLLNTNYREHLPTIIPSIKIGVLTILFLVPLTIYFRNMVLHPYVVLFLAGFTTSAGLLIIIIKMPRLFGKVVADAINQADGIFKKAYSSVKH